MHWTNSTSCVLRIPRTAIFFIVGCLRKTELTVIVEREIPRIDERLQGFRLLRPHPELAGPAPVSLFVCSLRMASKLDCKGRRPLQAWSRLCNYGRFQCLSSNLIPARRIIHLTGGLFGCQGLKISKVQSANDIHSVPSEQRPISIVQQHRTFTVAAR